MRAGGELNSRHGGEGIGDGTDVGLRAGARLRGSDALQSRVDRSLKTVAPVSERWIRIRIAKGGWTALKVRIQMALHEYPEMQLSQC